jgi:hypothetical protein
VSALAQRTCLILFWVGFLALFRGFSPIMLAFSIRHAGDEAAAIEAAIADTPVGGGGSP